MIAMIKTSPNCEAILKQGSEESKSRGSYLVPFKVEVAHLNVILFNYSFKQIFTESLLYTELG